MWLGNLCAWAQEEDWDEDEEFVQLPLGIGAVYRAPGGEALLERMEPMPRLFGTGGDTVHPRVPDRRFQVTWRGKLLVPYDGEYTFSLGRSSLRELRFTVGREEARFDEPVELEFGNVPFELTGVHGGGPPELELAWENEIFAREVIAPRFFGHVPAAARTPEITRQAMEDSGAALAESFGCFRCHEGPEAWVGSLSADLEPALFLPGPRLVRLDSGFRIGFRGHNTDIDKLGNFC